MLKVCGRRVSNLEAFIFMVSYFTCNYIVMRVRDVGDEMTLERPPAEWRLAETLQAHDPQHSQPGPEVDMDGPMKTILFWNQFGNTQNYNFGLGEAPFLKHKCPVSRCQTTTDASLLNQADAVVVHGPQVYNFPPLRPPGQVWVYVQEEPRYNISMQLMGLLADKFNLTMSHRSDSDIQLPYARILHDPANERHPVKRVILSRRSKDVAWIASHCATMSKREMYIRELRKHINVDIFGKCGKNKCKKGGLAHCLEDVVKDYKFVLAFEKSYCKDSLKKLFVPLHFRVIPVVYGAVNYSEVAPPHSVVDVADFASPKDLAAHLKALARHEKNYNSYFQWKSQGYHVDANGERLMASAFCKMCEILHTPSYKYKDYRDLKGWWVNDTCDPLHMPKTRASQGW